MEKGGSQRCSPNVAYALQFGRLVIAENNCKLKMPHVIGEYQQHCWQRLVTGDRNFTPSFQPLHQAASVLLLSACDGLFVARQWKPGARSPFLGREKEGKGGREVRRGEGRKKLPRGRLSLPRDPAQGQRWGVGAPPLNAGLPRSPLSMVYSWGQPHPHSLRPHRRVGGMHACARPVETTEICD